LQIKRYSKNLFISLNVLKMFLMPQNNKIDVPYRTIENIKTKKVNKISHAILLKVIIIENMLFWLLLLIYLIIN